MKKTLVGTEALVACGWKLVAESTNEHEELVKTGITKPAEFRIYRHDGLGLEIHTRRSLVKEGLDFLPGMVKDFETEKDLWSFFQEKEKSFKGLGYIVAVEGEVVIALSDWDGVKKVIPVADLRNIQTVMVGNTIKTVGGRGSFAMINLKHACAEGLSNDLGRKIRGVVTDEEREFLAKINNAEKAKRERERVARETARRERIAKMKSRPQITGVVVEGGKGNRWATPVTKDEWQSFGPNDGMVAIVSGFAEDGKPIIPENGVVEAFFIQNRGNGRLEKKATVKIRLNDYGAVEVGKTPVVSTTINLNVLETVIFEVSTDKAKELGLNAGFIEADLTNIDGLSALRKSGLNSGTLIAIPVPDQPERVQVERMLGEKGSQTLGIFERL